jgi:hypothetical protein
LALLAVVLAACGTPGDEDAAADDEAVDDTEVEHDEAQVADAEADDAGEIGDGAELPVTPASAMAGRKVIRTAELVLHVDRPAEAAEEVFELAERRGGFVAETDLERDAEGVVSGTITLRVPSGELVDAVDELDRLAASVPVRRIDETDVTSEATDLEARIRNLTNYERELNELLTDVRADTDRPDDLLTIFERIRDVRDEIERLEARRSVLSDQVALSTIRVTLRPADRAVPVADPTWSPSDQVRAALSTTARALQGIADAAIWVVLTALPVLLVLGSPVAAGALVWHRRRAAATSNP